MTARFDSLGYVRRLEDAGVERRIAETHAEVVRDFILDEVATKADVELVRADMRSLEERIDGKLDVLEQRMTVKLGGMLIAAVGLALAGVRFLL